ncbi:MAG: hypothetical protein MUE95_10705 [Cyclobacteriaceae bacterium]|jgi:hypothetical protein|nr:hypothetical protein [Cyclobacteriaceae bacterium]
MKKNLFYMALLLVAMASCSPATKITRTWTSPQKNATGYTNLYLAAVIGDMTIRTSFESDVQAKLNRLGINSTTSSSTIQPNFWMSTDLDKNAMMRIIGEKGNDAIMTMTLIDVQNEQRYIPGTMNAGMMAGPGMWGPGWGMGGAGNFGGFWGMHHGMMMTPGHIVNDRKYFVEINIYDVKSELLVWTGQSKTTNPSSVDKFSREFAEVVLKRMQRERVIQPQQN